MTNVSKYFKFLSNPVAFRMMNLAAEGKVGYQSMPDVSRKQYYTRLTQARELNLIMKRRGDYRLTALGELVLEKIKSIIEIDPTSVALRTIDALEEEELRLNYIHEFINKMPDARPAEVLSRPRMP